MPDFEPAVPILPVSSLVASLAHYVNLLGYHMNWQQPRTIGSVTRGSCTLFLCEGDQGHAGTWVWISVPDADTIFEELKAKGAIIRRPPTNYDWAYELQVEDLDGNVLRLASDQKTDRPLGKWLDMHGQQQST